VPLIATAAATVMATATALLLFLAVEEGVSYAKR
jgi:hypothetical protein